MLLGKRPRPPMKRTTSLSEITFDLNTVADDVLQGPVVAGVFNGSDQSRVLSTVSPRNHRRNSADFTNPPDFLRSCFLCKRPLVPGRDIYMYRGDSGFCSLECRQKQMNRDEKKDKSCVAVTVASSKKQQQPVPPVSPSGSKSRQITTKHETVVVTKS